VNSESSVLRDFTVDSRVWLLFGLALIIDIGVLGRAVYACRSQIAAEFLNEFSRSRKLL